MKNYHLFILCLIAVFALCSCGPKMHMRVNHTGAIELEPTEFGKHAISGSGPSVSSDYAGFQKNMSNGFMWKKYRELLSMGNYDEADKLLKHIKRVEKKEETYTRYTKRTNKSGYSKMNRGLFNMK